MEISAGLVIIQDNKILLGHPTGQKWKSTYSIPKGHVEEGETYLEAAIRETYEEIGIAINKDQIDENTLSCVEYKNNNKEVYKKVYYYVYKPKEELDISKIKLQLTEMDSANFLPKEEAEKRIFWRFKSVLEHLK